MVVATQNIYPFLRKKSLNNKVKVYKECDVVCFQEVKNRQQIKNLAKVIEDTHYHYHKRKAEYGKTDYLVTYSNLKPKEKGYFNIKIKGKLTGAALYSYLNGIVVYNCHFRVRNIGIEERILTFNKIVRMHSKNYKNIPVIITGDLNTVIPKNKGIRRVANFLINKSKMTKLDREEPYYFLKNLKDKGFKEVTNNEYTWVIPNTKIYYPYQKLDWFITKNLKHRSYTITPVIGDHHGIMANVEI